MLEDTIQLKKISNGWLCILPQTTEQFIGAPVKMFSSMIKEARKDDELESLIKNEAEELKSNLISCDENIKFFVELKDLFHFLEFNQ